MAEALRVHISGADRLERDLGVYADRLRAPFRKTDARQRVISYVNDEALRQMTHGQRSGDWKRLSPVYRAQKAKKYPGRPLLVITGRTVRSMTDSRSRDFIEKVKHGGRTMEIGTDYEIAGYHQKGTKRMPARPLFRLTRRVAERMSEIISEALTDGLK